MTTTPLPANTHCISCGYDLAGLAESGVCPECAAPCSKTVEHIKAREKEHDPIKSVRDGLQNMLTSYCIVACVAAVAVVLGILRSRVEPFDSILYLLVPVALIAIAVIFTTGIGSLISAYPSHKDPSKPCISQELMATTTLVGVVALLPFLVFSNYVSATVLHSALPAVFFLFILATARSLHNAALHLGVARTGAVTSAILTLSSLVFVVIVCSSLAREYIIDTYTPRLLGLTGGQWQDIFYLSLLALAATHFLLIFYFWLKLKPRLGAAKP